MSRQKVSQKKHGSGNSVKNQFGMFAIPDFDMDDGCDEDDNDLEEELMSIIKSDQDKPKPQRKERVSAANNLDRMVAESLKDIPSDASLSGDDENDPELLAEFELVTGNKNEEPPRKQLFTSPSIKNENIIKLINERIEMYKKAESNAKISGDVSKLRRLTRGLKTLDGLLLKANSGGVINENDIPLPVAITASKPVKEPDEEILPERSPPESEIFEPIPIDEGTSEKVVQREDPTKNTNSPKLDETTNDIDKSQLNILINRREKYKKAALNAKRSGDIKTALDYVKVAKQFDTVIEALESGQVVELNNMPDSPPKTFTIELQGLDKDSDKKSIPPPPPPSDVQESPKPAIMEQSVAESTAENEAMEVIKQPATVLEALEQRLAKFKEQEEAGKRAGNASKVRRMGRIIKQYEDAIKNHKAGRPIPADELPTPPGFAPIPVTEDKSTPKSTEDKTQLKQRSVVPRAQQNSTDQPISQNLKSPPNAQDSPSHSKTPTSSRSVSPGPLPVPPPRATTRQDKQLAVLRFKQNQFKEAAKQAKQSGNVEQAKEYLRLFKCFTPLIEATMNGLPVDLTTLPLSPGNKQEIEKEFEVVQLSDCIPGTTSEIYNQLIFDLQKQLKICLETRAHFKSMGDIANTNKFENLALNTKKDLDTIKIACNKDDPVPRFHYEMRTFSIVRCNTDLNDNDLELSIIQGINYNVPNPKEIDTYVRYEFPFPTDDPKKDKTNIVYNTNNPVYDSVFLLAIQRSNHACQRIFKRHGVKLEIWSKGGFLRSDVLVGTVNVKLLPLETKCTIHDSFNLMNGKKVVGGKLEVKIRVRNPIHTKQLEQMQEKWLVID